MNHVVPLVILPFFSDICMSMTSQSHIPEFFIPSIAVGIKVSNPSLTGISSACGLRHPCPPAAGFQSLPKSACSSKLGTHFLLTFAVSEGFEPPLRSHANLFSRQAPSTTRTTHRKFVDGKDTNNLQELLELCS